MFDHLVGRVQNNLRRAVIALEQHLAHVWKILAQAGNVARIGSAPTIDRVVDHDPVGDVGVDFIHIEIVHRAGILLPVNPDNLVVLDTAIYLDGDDHSRMEMAGRVQIVLARHAAWRLCVGQESSESELKTIPCPADILGEAKRLAIVQVAPPKLPGSAPSRLRVVAAVDHLPFEARVTCVDGDPMSMPWTGVRAAAVAKHAHLDGNSFGLSIAGDAFWPVMRMLGRDQQVHHQSLGATGRIDSSVQLIDLSLFQTHLPAGRRENS